MSLIELPPLCKACKATPMQRIPNKDLWVCPKCDCYPMLLISQDLP